MISHDQLAYPMSQLDRQRRRKQAVAEILGGADISEVARRYHLTPAYLRCCALKNGAVRRKAGRRKGVLGKPSLATTRIITYWRENPSWGSTRIARHFGVSHQWASQVRAKYGLTEIHDKNTPPQQ